jgi:iron-sulfur cluster insertion protein
MTETAATPTADVAAPEVALADVAVTENAARRIAFLMSRETQPSMLRVAVSGGGCSGFQYVFDFDTKRNDDDMVIEKQGAIVLIDSTSLDLLRGSTIDYVEEMVGSSFQVQNPNASSSCGCGTSFSV